MHKKAPWILFFLILISLNGITRSHAQDLHRDGTSFFISRGSWDIRTQQTISSYTGYFNFNGQLGSTGSVASLFTQNLWVSYGLEEINMGLGLEYGAGFNGMAGESPSQVFNPDRDPQRYRSGLTSIAAELKFWPAKTEIFQGFGSLRLSMPWMQDPDGDQTGTASNAPYLGPDALVARVGPNWQWQASSQMDLSLDPSFIWHWSLDASANQSFLEFLYRMGYLFPENNLKIFLDLNYTPGLSGGVFNPWFVQTGAGLRTPLGKKMGLELGLDRTLAGRLTGLETKLRLALFFRSKT